VSGVFPSGNFMLRGLGAIRTFCMDVSAITNKVVAPISAIPCELGINGSVVCTLCAHTLLCDTFEVTTILLPSSEVLIWVGYKTGSLINEFKHLNPNCSAPHRHMVGSCHILSQSLRACIPLDDLCVSRELGMFWTYVHPQHQTHTRNKRSSSHIF